MSLGHLQGLQNVPLPQHRDGLGGHLLARGAGGLGDRVRGGAAVEVVELIKQRHGQRIDLNPE